jgi:hypothetical protein
MPRSPVFSGCIGQDLFSTSTGTGFSFLPPGDFLSMKVYVAAMPIPIEPARVAMTLSDSNAGQSHASTVIARPEIPNITISHIPSVLSFILLPSCSLAFHSI